MGEEYSDFWKWHHFVTIFFPHVFGKLFYQLPPNDDKDVNDLVSSLCCIA